jgi:hypothetical protein
MNRLPDWDRRIRIWIDDVSRRQFKFGQWDCGVMAASCVDAITGSSIAASLTHAEGSVPGNLIVIANRLIGADRQITHTMARRGDIHIIRAYGCIAYAIDYADQLIVANTVGIKLIPKCDVFKFIKSWSI